MDNESFWKNQYRRNLDRITGLCYLYVGNLSIAEDLAQDIFLKAMEKFHTIRAVFNFDTWLKRIAVNHCIDYLRQQPNFVPLPAELADEKDAEEAVLWVRDITADELAETIRQLPEMQCTVFNLYAIEGYSHKRIATLLGISVDYSKQLHHRARARLGKMLADKHEIKKTERKD